MSLPLLAFESREIGRFAPPGLDRTAEKSKYTLRGQMEGRRVFPRRKKRMRTRLRPEAMRGDSPGLGKRTIIALATSNGDERQS